MPSSMVGCEVIESTPPNEVSLRSEQFIHLLGKGTDLGSHATSICISRGLSLTVDALRSCGLGPGCPLPNQFGLPVLLFLRPTSCCHRVPQLIVRLAGSAFFSRARSRSAVVDLLCLSDVGLLNEGHLPRVLDLRQSLKSHPAVGLGTHRKLGITLSPGYRGLPYRKKRELGKHALECRSLIYQHGLHLLAVTSMDVLCILFKLRQDVH